MVIAVVATACRAVDVRPSGSGEASRPSASAASATASPTVGLGRDPHDGDWWTLDPVFSDPSSLTGLHLLAGTFRNNRPSSINRRFAPVKGEAMRGALPAAAGPAGGIVAFSFWDGQESQVRTISIAGGGESLAAQTPDVVTALAIGPAADWIYFATLDRDTYRAKDLLRVSARGGAPEKVVSLASVERAPTVQIVVTPNGASLAVMTCETTCEISLLAVSEEKYSWTVPTTASWMAGIDDAHLLNVESCSDPCASEVIDLATGDRQLAGIVCDAAVLAAGPDAAVVSNAERGGSCARAPEGSAILSYPLASPQDGVLVRRFASGARSLVAPSSRVGLDVDRSWVVVASGGDLILADGGEELRDAPWFVHIPDGAVAGN
jgi:hypothetical protein